ncbi:MAG: Na(+)-translocating NADH-quinone reductase subunit C, partial [Enterobacteriaceae bacterium]
MARNNDSIGNTLLVIIVLCLVCSIVVAGSAVGLKAKQDQQKQLDKQVKILEVTGLMLPDLDIQKIEQRYQQFIEPRLIELQSGRFIDKSPASFDMAAALKDPSKSRDLPANQDPAGIRRVSNIAEIYLVKDQQGKVNQLVLPVYGNGLWSV